MLFSFFHTSFGFLRRIIEGFHERPVNIIKYASAKLYFWVATLFSLDVAREAVGLTDYQLPFTCKPISILFNHKK